LYYDNENRFVSIWQYEFEIIRIRIIGLKHWTERKPKWLPVSERSQR